MKPRYPGSKSKSERKCLKLIVSEKRGEPNVDRVKYSLLCGYRASLHCKVEKRV